MLAVHCCAAIRQNTMTIALEKRAVGDQREPYEMGILAMFDADLSILLCKSCICATLCDEV